MQPQRSHTIALSFDHHTIVLAVRCDECKGDRLVYSKAWAAWNERHPEWPVSDEALRDDPMPNEPEELQCPECEGAGLTTTREGRVILDLVYTFPR